MKFLVLAVACLASLLRLACALPLSQSAASSSPTTTSADNSTIHVTVSFFSIPTFPDSGETEDVVILPLGELRHPGEIEGLPLHPLRARIMGAQHSAGPSGRRAAYADLNQITCEASLVGEHKAKEQLPLVAVRPILFRFPDDEVVFRNINESRTINDLKLLSFGCW